MSLTLYAHPFSSYCQKVLIALYENRTPFEFRMLAPDDAQVQAEFAALWPLRRVRVHVQHASVEHDQNVGLAERRANVPAARFVDNIQNPRAHPT